MPNHDTRITYIERGYQDKLNDTTELWLQPSEPATRVARRWRSSWDERDTYQQFFFEKPKIPLELNNINKQIIIKSQSSLLSQGYKILIVRVM